MTSTTNTNHDTPAQRVADGTATAQDFYRLAMESATHGDDKACAVWLDAYLAAGGPAPYLLLSAHISMIADYATTAVEFGLVHLMRELCRDLTARAAETHAELAR